MKKLIALMFCLAVTTTLGYAQKNKPISPNTGAMQETLAQVISAEARAVDVEVNEGGDTGYGGKGKAILIGFDKGQVLLLATPDLATELSYLSNAYGRITSGTFATAKAKKLTFIDISKPHSAFAKVSLSVSLNDKQKKEAAHVRTVSDEQAIKLAQIIQMRERKKEDAYREKVIDQSRKK